MSMFFKESDMSGLDAHSVFGKGDANSSRNTNKRYRTEDDSADLRGLNSSVLDGKTSVAEDIEEEEEEEDDEEPSHIQDENMAKVFEKFLKTFKEPKEDDEEDDDDESVWKDNLNYDFPSNLEITKDAHYIIKLVTLLQNSYSRSKVLVVDMKHLLMWSPTGNKNFYIGNQLYMYIKSHFLRIMETFEHKVQLLAESINPIKSKEVGKLTLRFYNKKIPIHSLRSLRCEMLGEMISIRGQVTRTSDVRPELTLASFKCNECGNIINGVKQQFRYTQPNKCPSASCGNMFDWQLVLEQSYFVDWQKIRLQEIAQESPPGSMPRNMDVILRNDLVDSVHAGDRIIVTGCLIVVPDIPTLMKPGDVPRSVARQMLRKNESSLVSQGLTGIKGVGVQDLNHKLCIYGCQIEKLNTSKKDTSLDEENEVEINCEELLNCDDLKWLREIALHPNTIDILAECIAPKIWGNIEIKKGALLMMTGGVQKITTNCKLRGDINMCIVGDPGTAKSEILKYVESFAPRAIFTSGKGSSAAGLTAAVHRDPDQGDTVLEAGALMYADQGICCIDEFDKMDEKDRVAIHEAMEQQTISITKAGIQATLNARASVLAACNPKYGRYDTLKTFAQNVNIPSPLLSRFDLFYTMLDTVDIDKDTNIANHLVSMHCGPEEREKHLSSQSAKLDTLKLEIYLELSKRVKPLLTDEAKYKLVHYYVSFRNIEYSPGAQRSMRMTVRQLESLVRLSEAVAKLKFSHYVEVKHVEIACAIFKASMKKISNEKEINLDEGIQMHATDMGSVNAAGADAEIGETGDDANKRKVTTIKASEYQCISAIIIEIIKEYEFNNNNESIRTNTLIESYLHSYAKAESNEEVDEWVEKLRKIIYRLVHQDMKLLSEHNDLEPDNPILRIHPNYAGPVIENAPVKNAYDYSYKNFKDGENVTTDDIDFKEDIDNF